MRQYPYNIYFPHSNVVVDIQFFILVLFYHPDSLDIKFCSLDVLAKDAKVHSCIDGRDKYTFFQRGVKENVSYTNGGDKLLVCTPPPPPFGIIQTCVDKSCKHGYKGLLMLM